MAFLSIALLIVASYVLVVHNLRLQSNMLEASSVSYELRILIDQSNEQFNLLFDPLAGDNYSDRILNKIRHDFVATTEDVTVMMQRLEGLLMDHHDSFGSLFSAELCEKINVEMQNINDVWGRFQTRIDEIASYDTSTLRAGNKLWQPIDTSIANRGTLSNSISSLNDLVYQASMKQNQRLWFVYTILLFFLLSSLWGIWLFTLKPLAARLRASYQDILSSNERLDHQANHDALTGLLNRAAFNKKVAEVESSNEVATAHCLVLVDLDNFKLINDTLGHNVGDLVLQKVSADLLDSQMQGEYAYRLGGDEFALWITRVGDESLLRRRLETLLAKVRMPLVADGNTIQTSCSVGAVIAGRDHGYDHKEMFAAADSMLYQVKERGRDGYQLYSETQSARLAEMVQSDSMLSNSVEQQAFLVSYQPIIQIQTRQTQGFEARIHWDHPTYGLVHHDNWMKDATRLMLDSEITKHVIESIRKDFHYWQEQNVILRPVTVDIGKTILLSGEAYTLISHLASELPDPSLIGIEVSEMMFNERSFEAIVQQLERFKSAGIPITVDHYGRGQSSLVQLRQIPFDVIKIDKHLTLKASYDPSLKTYISSLANFTEGMGKKLLCQDIQGKTERRKLLELGCLYMQSRHISTVLNPQEVAKHLQETQVAETT